MNRRWKGEAASQALSVGGQKLCCRPKRTRPEPEPCRFRSLVSLVMPKTAGTDYVSQLKYVFVLFL